MYFLVPDLMYRYVWVLFPDWQYIYEWGNYLYLNDSKGMFEVPTGFLLTVKVWVSYPLVPYWHLKPVRGAYWYLTDSIGLLVWGTYW